MHRTEVERIVESQDWTPTGDWTFTGTVTFSGSSAETFESIIVDGTSAEALLIRKDSDGGDVLTVDTTNSLITFNRARDNASNKMLTLKGNSRTTPADNDEAYFSYMLEADDGNQKEVGRMNWVFSDVTLGSMQSRFSWEVLKGASLTEALSVGSDVSGNLEVRMPNDDQPLMQGAADDYKQEWDGTNEVYTISAGAFVFSGGYMAIGRTTATKMLHVEDASHQIMLTDTGQGGSSNQHAILNFSDGGNNSLEISTGLANAGNKIFLSPGDTTTFTTLRNGNTGINTSTFDGTAAKVFAIANGTAPGGGTADQAYLYCISGEMKVMDSAGNETLLSPHDAETGDWIFFSQNKTTGRKVRINMERMIRKLEQFTGESFIETDGV